MNVYENIDSGVLFSTVTIFEDNKLTEPIVSTTFVKVFVITIYEKQFNSIEKAFF